MNEEISDCSKQKPEWVRIPDAMRLFGMTRAYLYNLVKDGKIEARSLGRIRLIRYASLQTLIEGSPK
jgi:excisionase family DNA binding protein